jgi:hypothetical protein
MTKKLLIVFAFLTFKGLPQSGNIDAQYYPEETLPPMANNISLLKCSFSCSVIYPQQMNFDSETFLTVKSTEYVSNKSSWLAFGLSLLYPGLGQFYNGEYDKSLLMGGIATLGLSLVTLAAISTNYDSESNPEYLNVILYSGVVVFGGTYIWSLVDAPISASNINERNRKFGITIFSTEDEIFALRLRSGNKLNNYSLGFSVTFNRWK